MLLADDNEAMRRDIRQLVEREFEVVAVVSDGDQLLAQGLSATADVIVVDISMPGTDGITAARLLKAVASPDLHSFAGRHSAAEHSASSCSAPISWGSCSPSTIILRPPTRPY